MVAEEDSFGGIDVNAAELRRFIRDLLQTQDVSQEDADICAHVLVEADLTGRSTHGISRLPMYFSRLRERAMNRRPQVSFDKQFGALAQCDGDNGLGPVVAYKAMTKSIDMANAMGMGGVFVKSSNHCGAMSVYCSDAADQGLILMCLTNSPPAIPPWGGKEAYFGTNPVAFGFPRQSQRHIIVDLATSVVARGNIMQAARRNQAIPENWALNSDGQATIDPKEALKGVLLPMAGAKGYALALAFEMLTGVLSGAAFGPHVKSPYEDHGVPSDVGHFFLAINPGALMDPAEYDARLEQMVAEILQVKPMESLSIRLPGERAHRMREAREQFGVPIDGPLVDQLGALSREYGIRALASC